MQISEIVMTPAHAAKLLQTERQDRTLSQARIAAIAADIANGKWQLDGSPIRISKSGKLIDGQHRLSAIVRAKQDVPLLLVEGLDDEAQLVVDSGKARTFNDYLMIRGYPDHLTAATTTRLLWRYENGDIAWEGDWNARPIPTLTDLWEMFSARQQEIQEAVTVGRRVGRFVRLSRSVVAVSWIACSRISMDYAEEFFAQLSCERPQGSQAVTLTRSMNNREGVAGRKGQVDQKWQMAFMFKAWNAYRDDRNITLIRWTRGGKNREGFPYPE